ncbi:TIGR02444 family protein [Halomonas sp. SH5A2]|uniref:TIGR02444 family protein n=1 Tax=Halomonas sp. SH5A2 TaxID=2749040 RepID=UPI001641F172|nr:TIGR02444 family protein [Halomonas sp. SH5A2]QNI04505.1 TIGR02444 family protein [Halomonas sp. SH5A2]
MPDSTVLDSTRFAALQQTPLWDFALTFYSCPGVEQACLTLQDDADVDVCELLFHGWLYVHGLEALPESLAALRPTRRDWQAGVTEVLRGLRRDLKHHDASSETVSALRERIKQAELLAERENLQRWQTWAWDNEQPSARLKNTPVSLHDAGRWLQERVLLPHDSMLDGYEPKARKALEHAFSVLGQQLDPLQRAR